MLQIRSILDVADNTGAKRAAMGAAGRVFTAQHRGATARLMARLEPVLAQLA